MTTPAAIEAAFEKQVRWCGELGSPFTAALLTELLADLRAGGPCAALLRDWRDDPDDAALPLRLAGGLHALVLARPEGPLAAAYPPRVEAYGPATAAAVRQALIEEAGFLRALLASAPQTNEVRRSIVLLGGFLVASRSFGLPLRLLEVGASAGLNLAWPHYRYETTGWAWGRPEAALRLDTDWLGLPPPVDEQPLVASAEGCDLAPVDLADPAQFRRLQAYVWADQRERLERLRGAATIARETEVRVEQASAEAWLAAKLATPAPGRLTLVYHSVFHQYLPAAAAAAMSAAIEAAAARATAEAPLGHLRYERDEEGHGLRLTLWPGGEDRLLARADPHARWVEWRG